jgi:hypothetical protein
MVPLSMLWLPILLSAVIVFVASSLIHMVLTYHRSDYRTMPSEGEVMEALRRFSIPPGDYIVPHASSPKEMESAAFKEKRARGPVMVATVMKTGAVTMGPQLVQWFIFCVVVSLFAGYIAGRALPPGSEYLDVHRFAGTVAFAGYGLGQWPNSIWFRRSWSSTIKSTVDALIYGLLTGGTFGWLWPQ